MEPELYTFFISMMPFIELRGAIPIGISLGLPTWEAWLLSVLGNLIPILPVLYLFQPISKILIKFKWYRLFYEWLHRRSVKKGQDKLDKYGALGLFIFTAVPLPTTGAWGAAFVAAFFQVKVKYAFVAISLGVITASIIVTGLSEIFL